MIRGIAATQHQGLEFINAALCLLLLLALRALKSLQTCGKLLGQLGDLVFKSLLILAALSHMIMLCLPHLGHGGFQSTQALILLHGR